MSDLVLEDALREAGVPEHRVQILAFLARAPERVVGESCARCGVDLSARPVMTKVRRTGMGITEPNGSYEKRVRMKPAQLVVAARVEGSMGLTPEWNAAVSRPAWRFCAPCALTFVPKAAS